MTDQELLKFVTDNCYQTPAFTLKPGLFSAPGINRILLNYFGNDGIKLSAADAPLLEGRIVKVSNGKFATEWIRSREWETLLLFSIGPDKNPIMEISLRMKAGNYRLGNSFKSLEANPAGIFPLTGTVFSTRSDAPPSSELEKLQEQLAGCLYLTDEDANLGAPLQFSAVIAVPENMKWLEGWLPESKRKLNGVLQLKKDNWGEPRFLLSSPEYELELPGYFSISAQLQAICTWKDVFEKSGELYATDAMRLLARLNYQIPGGDKISIPVSCMWNGLVPEQLVIEAQTGKAISYLLKEFIALLGGADLAAFLPEGIAVTDMVTLRSIRIVCNVSDRKLQQIDVEFGLPDERPTFPLIPGVADLTKLIIRVSVADPLVKRNVSASMYGGIAFPNTALYGPVESNLQLPGSDFVIGLGQGASINLVQLYKQLLPGIPVPFASLECNECSIQGNFRAKSFRLAASISSADGIDLYFLKVKNAGFAFEYASGSGNSNSLVLNGTAYINEKIRLQVSAAYRDKGFHFSGSLAQLPDKELKLSDLLPLADKLPKDLAETKIKKIGLEFSTSPARLKFVLDSETVIHLGDAGKVQLNGLTITVEKPGTGYSYKFETSGKVQLIPLEGKPDGLIDLSGKVTIEGSTEKFKLVITDDGTGKGITIPLLVPSKIIEGKPEFSEAEFKPQIFSFVWEKKDWKISSSFALKITKTWEVLKNLLPPDGFKVKLTIGKTESTIEFEDEILDLKIPDLILPAPNKELPPKNLGPSRFTIGDIKLRLAYKKNFSLSAEISASYYLPQSLNHLFGTITENNVTKPKLEIFETYDPGKPTTPIALTFKAGYIDGSIKAGVILTKFPLKNMVERSETEWLINLGPIDPVDKMGKYGCIRLNKPDFNFDSAKGGFKASGGWNIEKKLAIPLDFVRTILENAKMFDLAKRLPPVLPIPHKIEFFKDNKFNIKAVTEFFQGALPEQLVNAIAMIADQTVDKFPEAIKPYFTFGIPDGLNFDIVVTATGSASIDISVPENHPGIKMLFLQPVPAPFVLGMTLRKFSFGQVFGGLAFRIKIDGEFDMFDIVSLAAGMIADKSWYPFIGQPDKYHSTLMLHDLIVLVFYQASGIPVPVPVFYKKIGVDYYGIGGTTFKSSFEFEEPDFSKLGPMLVNIIRFFTDAKFPMPEQGDVAPNIRFTIGQNYFQSDLLKIGPIGLTQPYTPVDLYRFIASLMNTAKFFDIESFIKSIPADKRIGAAKVDLDFICIHLKAKAAWVFCTPYEFLREGGVAKDFLAGDEKSDMFMKILPIDRSQPVGEKDKGLILFAKGDWTTNYGTLKAGFGLAALSARKFGVGFFVRGVVSGLFYVEAEAFLLMDPPKRPFQAYGKSKTFFNLINLKILDGETTIDVSQGPNDIKQFKVDGKFTLVELGDFFTIRSTDNMGGEFSGDQLHLQGGVQMIVLGFLRFELRGQIGSRGIELKDGPMKLSVLKRDAHTIVIDTKIPFGLTPLSLYVQIHNPPSGKAYIITNFESSLAGMLTLKSSSTAYLGEDPPTSTGTINLFILEFLNPKPVLSGTARIGSTLSFTGAFNLLGNDVLNIKGTVTLNIASNGVTGSGSAGLWLLGREFIGGTVILNQNGIFFYTHDRRFDLQARICRGEFFFIGKVDLGLGPVEGYISNKGKINCGMPDECKGIVRTSRKPKYQFEHYFEQLLPEMVIGLHSAKKAGKKSKASLLVDSKICKNAYHINIRKELRNTARKPVTETRYELVRLAPTTRGNDLFTALLADVLKKAGKKYADYIPSPKDAYAKAVHFSHTHKFHIEFHFPKSGKEQLQRLAVIIHQTEMKELPELIAADFMNQVANLKKQPKAKPAAKKKATGKKKVSKPAVKKKTVKIVRKTKAVKKKAGNISKTPKKKTKKTSIKPAKKKNAPKKTRKR